MRHQCSHTCYFIAHLAFRLALWVRCVCEPISLILHTRRWAMYACTHVRLECMRVLTCALNAYVCSRVP